MYIYEQPYLTNTIMNHPTLLFISLIISFLLPSTTSHPIPHEWIDKISASNALYAPSDDAPINSEGYPDIYIPLIGNGYFSHSKGVRSDTYYISGVYNNQTTSPSHRARIPATFAVTISNSETTGVLLDMLEGTYTRRGVICNTGWYELRWYAHRDRRSVYVMELEAHLQPGVENMTLELTNNAGDASEDIIFTRKIRKLGNIEITVQCGDTTIPETPFSEPTRVCMAYTAVPTAVTVSTRTFQTFVTATRTSLDARDVEDAAIQDCINALRTNAKLPHDIEAPTQTYKRYAQSALLVEHVRAWATLWSSGVEISSRADVAVAVNASLFAILSSVRDDWPYGLAPGGLTNYYNGHSFWDTETWMYPPLLLLHSSIAESLIKYRFDRLNGAYMKAKSYTPPYKGAMFPWESAFSGYETCPTWADTGLREQHISADISLAVYQYYLMTQDKYWLRHIGLPILTGVADFFLSRAVYDNSGQAHIYDVIPPDEYADHCDDSVYTNYAASNALRYAVSAMDVLDIDGTNLPNYTTLAESLTILYDSELGIHPEYKGYNGELIKQADAVLLHYPWGMEMDVSTQQNDLEYYSKLTDDNGPAMTWGMHSIGYKDLLLLDKASQYFNKSFENNMQPPFMVWTETASGNAGNFITGAGGFLHTLTFGYPGLRIESNRNSKGRAQTSRLLIDTPVCPEMATGVKLRGTRYLGSVLDVSYSCNVKAGKCPAGMAHEISIRVTSMGPMLLEFVVLNNDNEVPTSTVLKEDVEVSIKIPCDDGDKSVFVIQEYMA
mmetsp:Transcript_15402/g.23217  ORF Transcript_15402/g.23217 Transcript_15402/m.23217 type:complete len:782 (-) Transcript_15402:137-2482(-)